MSLLQRLHPGIYSAGRNGAPPLFFLHGWLGSAQDWTETVGSLCKDYHCTALDLPGHGECVADPAGTLSLADAVDFLSQRMSRLSNGRPVILAGYSLGGRLAVEIALEQGVPVSGLVLMSSRPGLPDESRSERIASDLTWRDRILENWPGFLEEWYAQPLFGLSGQTPDKLRDRIQGRYGTSSDRAAETLLNWSPAHQADRMGWLVDCPVPLLYMAGSKDQKYADLAESLRAKSTAARVEILEESGHAVHLDTPQQCANLMKKFLECNRETLWP